MPKSQVTPDELKAAIKALKIDVPVLSYWKEGTTIIMVLLGGKKVSYNPEKKTK